MFDYLVQAVRHKLGLQPPRKLKRHIRPDLSVDRFFVELQQRNVRYALLRWFEELPYIRPGGDVDILVDDADVKRIKDLFSLGEGALRCDLYSVTGLPGTSYRGKSYLPVDRARELLDRAVQYRTIYMVPADEDHFLSLAYHAIYHKGLKSGLPTRYSHLQPNPVPNHDYAAILACLAARVGVQISMDMEGLADHLAKCGWLPSEAAIHDLARHNPWVCSYYHVKGS